MTKFYHTAVNLPIESNPIGFLQRRLVWNADAKQ